MSKNAHHLLSAIDRPLIVRTRGDIQQVAIPVAGQPCFILKDPLTLEHFQLTATEHFLFEELGEPVTLGELKSKFEERFAPRTISVTDLQHGINQLFEQGLLVSTAPGQGKQLLERETRHQRGETWRSLLKMLSFRVASWDGSRIIEATYSKVSWLFHPLAFFAATCVVAYALWLLLAHGADIVARLPAINELWQPQFLLLWLGTIALVKVAHELGHAVTCRHVGGRCHEMGLMLLALLPALYCDVSDVWSLPGKWRRMAVSAAGMVVEVVIAAAAFAGWWHTEPGLLNTWLLGVAIVCSVGTLAINANPLLRYDGYYLLADWLEIPNLAGRAQGLLYDKLRGWLLAERPADDPLLTRKQGRQLALYAMASRVYALIVILAIYAMLLALARPVHLENLVYTLAVFTLAGLLLPPLLFVWRLLRNPANRAQIHRSRAATIALVGLTSLAVVLFWPIRHTVKGTAVLIPAGGHPIYASLGGHVTSALAPGTVVKAGEIIARLSDPSVELALLRQEGDVAVKQARFEQLNILRALESRLSRQLPTAHAELLDANAQLEQHRARAEELILKAPVDGVVIEPPHQESEEHADRLARWSGSPLEKRNQGAWIEPGTIVATVGNPKELAALVTIDERDIAEVQPGEPVKILMDSTPVQILSGKVKQVASRATEPAPDEMAVTKARRHVVEVELEQTDSLTLVGATATAKIEASRTTLYGLARDYLKRRLKMPW